jgi:hypothetical protein
MTGLSGPRLRHSLLNERRAKDQLQHQQCANHKSWPKKNSENQERPDDRFTDRDAESCQINKSARKKRRGKLLYHFVLQIRPDSASDCISAGRYTIPMPLAQNSAQEQHQIQVGQYSDSSCAIHAWVSSARWPQGIHPGIGKERTSLLMELLECILSGANNIVFEKRRR